ncbi:endocuticle structural glycoprotein SgAbd-8-like [Bombus vosnesenskii]|uniref:Endocuticle structural glycoprotein SgAbd-8-like n=2 Tax=Pyrobombus TaxID=144703 RepID=A0A6J3KXM9_9HYME|nr:endocuticle structural glycoprotein SgAbd-8-like [Bombus vancouverensis nearcticus]XP_033309317.1 endocuticle structural glycoprotein SgAbd-8-like [Bombus bifarius]XP_033357920.1 endocuticle structural glycoprotein SgAbd-8-like [Bombus vosnesenskii]XP_050480938.1 endocuticle structural glycoprotein SgAbd-8-like [Bombus huntii]
MHFRTICLLNVVVMALAADKPIAIVSQSQDISPDGSFYSKWETANGIAVEEEGVLKNRGQKDAEAEEVRGSASWTAPDGTKINLGWLANENGATFQGPHLPTPPPTQPIPVLIQRALDWIAAHPSKDAKNGL